VARVHAGDAIAVVGVGAVVDAELGAEFERVLGELPQRRGMQALDRVFATVVRAQPAVFDVEVVVVVAGLGAVRLAQADPM
jgi:hypothetical protein